MNLDFDSIEKELKRALDEIFQVSDIKKVISLLWAAPPAKLKESK